MRDGDIITKEQIKNNNQWEMVNCNSFLKSETYVNFELELSVTFYNGEIGTVGRYI